MDYKIAYYGRKIVGFFFSFSGVKGHLDKKSCSIQKDTNTILNWRDDRLVESRIVMRGLPTQCFTYLLQWNDCITPAKDLSVLNDFSLLKILYSIWPSAI